MKSTQIDKDGNVRCPKCGAIAFDQKRTGKAKWVGVATIGVGAVAMPKRLKCRGCGENLKRGNGEPYVSKAEKVEQYDALRAARAEQKAEKEAEKAAAELLAVPASELPPFTYFGYMNEVGFDGKVLRARGTNKMARVALAGADHAGDVVLRVSEIEGMNLSTPTAMVNGALHVEARGNAFKLHFRKKSGPEFAELAERLQASMNAHAASPVVVAPADEVVETAGFADEEAQAEAGPVVPPPPPPMPADWYANPDGPGRRYWDGSAWTEHTAP